MLPDAPISCCSQGSSSAEPGSLIIHPGLLCGQQQSGCHHLAQISLPARQKHWQRTGLKAEQPGLELLSSYKHQRWRDCRDFKERRKKLHGVTLQEPWGKERQEAGATYTMLSLDVVEPVQRPWTKHSACVCAKQATHMVHQFPAGCSHTDFVVATLACSSTPQCSRVPLAHIHTSSCCW